MSDPNQPQYPPAPNQPPVYGQPGQYSQPAAPYGQPGAYGQPGQYGQPGPYGQPGYPQQGYAQMPGTNLMAILSLIFAFVFSPAGVVLGHISLSQIKKTGEQGRGLAIAGLIIGYISIAFIVIYIVFIIFIVILGATSGSYHSYS